MLNAVISHLKVLKNTSINGLREAFLKRSGKLSIGDTNTFELIVDTKPSDILLNNLPWGIGIINSPMMNCALSCTW